MKISRLLFLIIFSVLVVVVPGVLAQSPETENLVGTQWQLVSFGTPGSETPVVEGSTVILEFTASNEIAGSGGCNSYGGNYTAQQGSITFSEIVSTLMACADGTVTQQEQTYVDALRSATTYAVAEDMLTIWYGNDNVLNFTSTPTDNERLLQAVEWRLVSYETPETTTPVIPDSNVTINFLENDQIEGNGGCNQYSGVYATENNTITLSDIISTLMACADNALTQQEVDFMAALSSATRYEITNNALAIWFDNEQARLNFEYHGQDADILQGSMWQLESYGNPNAPTAVIPGSDVTLNFETQTSIEGNGGCNTYSADYQIVATLVAFSDLVHTEIACADQSMTNQEQIYFGALESATSIEGFFDRLVITYPNGQLNFTIIPNETPTTPVPPVDLPTTCTNPWVVQLGDTLSQIAVTCGVTVEAILAANPQITNPAEIIVGQEITIPQGEVIPTEVPPVDMPEGCSTTYTVIAGDTLLSIATTCHTTVEAILAANPQITDPTQLEAGEVINIPQGEVIPTEVPPVDMPEGCSTTYTVVTGDTIATIAETCHVTVEAILAANAELTDPNQQVEPGQVINIPQDGISQQIFVEQTSAAPGEVVNVAGSGFAPNIDLDIGFGLVNSEFQIIGAARTTTDGSFRTTVTIPETTDPNLQWVFGAIAPDGSTVISAVFDITAN